MKERPLKFEFAERKRPWWKRLLASLRLTIRPGKNLKRPVSLIGINGHVEF